MPKTVASQLASTEQQNELQVVYLYEFTHMGSTYRYAAFEDFVFVGTTQYQPGAFTHDRGGGPDRDSIVVNAGLGPTWLRQYFLQYGIQPITVRILRAASSTPTQLNTTDTYVEFAGKVTNVLVKGGVATMTVTATGAGDKLAIPNNFYQPQCNWKLFGSGCGLTKSSYSVTANLYAVSRDNRTVTFPMSASKPNGWFEAGEIVIRGRSYPVNNSINNGDGTQTVSLAIWPIDVAVGDSITAYAGCTRTAACCNNRFANLANFGGFPYVPTQNPTLDGV